MATGGRDGPLGDKQQHGHQDSLNTAHAHVPPDFYKKGSGWGLEM